MEGSKKTTPSNGLFALTGATLIDGNGGTPLKDSVVLVKDGFIEAVGSRSSIDLEDNIAIDKTAIEK